jgi:hypothetical protein
MDRQTDRQTDRHGEANRFIFINMIANAPEIHEQIKCPCLGTESAHHFLLVWSAVMFYWSLNWNSILLLAHRPWRTAWRLFEHFRNYFSRCRNTRTFTLGNIIWQLLTATSMGQHKILQATSHLQGFSLACFRLIHWRGFLPSFSQFLVLALGTGEPISCLITATISSVSNLRPALCPVATRPRNFINSPDTGASSCDCHINTGLTGAVWGAYWNRVNLCDKNRCLPSSKCSPAALKRKL